MGDTAPEILGCEGGEDNRVPTFSHSLFMKDGANRRNNLKGRKKFLNYNILIVFVRKTVKKGHSSFSLSQ